jgi:hypothetical protein
MPDASVALILDFSNETNSKYDTVFQPNGEPVVSAIDDMTMFAYDHLTTLVESLSINRTDTQLRQAATSAIKIDVQLWKMLNQAGAYKSWELEYDRTGSFLEAINMPLTKVRFETIKQILPIVSQFPN